MLDEYGLQRNWFKYLPSLQLKNECKLSRVNWTFMMISTWNIFVKQRKCFFAFTHSLSGIIHKMNISCKTRLCFFVSFNPNALDLTEKHFYLEWKYAKNVFRTSIYNNVLQVLYQVSWLYVAPTLVYTKMFRALLMSKKEFYIWYITP